MNKDTLKFLNLIDLPDDVAEIFASGKFPKDWAYSRGGHGLHDNQWYFNTVSFDEENNMHEEIYLIPKCMNIIIDGEAKQAVSNKVNKIKRELDL